MKRYFAPVLGLVLLSTTAQADPRPWTFTYDLYPEGKGNLEYEQWITWKHHTKDESGFDRVEFRHEIEWGVTDNFDLSFYVPNWSLENSRERTGSRFDSAGVEGILYLSKPTDWIGIGLYGEINVGPHFAEFEQKILVQKDIGPWSFAYNLVFETEIEREKDEVTGERENEVEGVIGNVFALSWSANKNWRIGAELQLESIYEDWSHYTRTEIYAGPAIGYTGNGIPGTKANWWVTVTPAFQLSNHHDEPDFILRVLAGIEF
jgi:hypothetical protein